jgi:hypothetical protein
MKTALKQVVILFVFFVILFYVVKPAFSSETKTYDDCLHAIHLVESGGKTSGVKPGDSSLAIGPFQIHKEYWKDALEYDRSIGGKYSDCNNYEYSLKVVKAYMNRYASKYIKEKNWEAVSRIHNAGPKMGTQSEQATKNAQKYWEKVKKYL